MAATFNNPIVFSYNVNMLEYEETLLPDSAEGPPFDETRLVAELIQRSSVTLGCKPALLEEQSNGENLSVRLAMIDLDLDKLESAEFPPWELMEVAPYSEIYEGEFDHEG